MRKYKYIKISNSRKIRYLTNYYRKNLYIIFLHGFMSDLEGDKPLNFLKFCKRKKLGFLGMEYSGHGKSFGKFTNGNISQWSNQVKLIIRKIVKNNNFILVGSSMGAWLSLCQFKFFNKQIKGFLGIGSAPEFLTRLMWNKFPRNIKREIVNYGHALIKNGDYEYPITYQLIKDGRLNKVLDKQEISKIKVTMIHGKRDEVVPVLFSKLVLRKFKNAKKKLVLIKGGDHSLSSEKHLKIILKELKSIVKDII